MAYSLSWVMQDVYHQPYGVQFFGSEALESGGMLLLLLINGVSPGFSTEPCLV